MVWLVHHRSDAVPFSSTVQSLLQELRRRAAQLRAAEEELPGLLLFEELLREKLRQEFSPIAAINRQQGT